MLKTVNVVYIMNYLAVLVDLRDDNNLKKGWNGCISIMNLFSRLLNEINTFLTSVWTLQKLQRSFKFNQIEMIWDKRDDEIFEGLKTLNVNNCLFIYWFMNKILRRIFRMQLLLAPFKWLDAGWKLHETFEKEQTHFLSETLLHH